MLDHLRSHGHVILQVRVEGDRRIGLADLREETGQQRVLVTDIA